MSAHAAHQRSFSELTKTGSRSILRNLLSVAGVMDQAGAPQLAFVRKGKPWASLQAMSLNTRRVSPDALAIDAAIMSPHLQRQGLGRKLYGRLVDDAARRRAAGDPVRWVDSDGRGMSPAARGLWESLKRRGYPITDHPSGASQFRLDLDEVAKQRGYVKRAASTDPVDVLADLAYQNSLTDGWSIRDGLASHIAEYEVEPTPKNWADIVWLRRAAEKAGETDLPEPPQEPEGGAAALEDRVAKLTHRLATYNTLLNPEKSANVGEVAARPAARNDYHQDNSSKLLRAASDDPMGLAQQFIGSTAGGAITGAAGTSTILATGGLLTKNRMPMLGQMLLRAAKDGVRIFDPRVAYQAMKTVPEGTRLFGQEMKLISQAEALAAMKNLPKLSVDPQKIINAEKKLAEFKNLRKELSAFHARHGMTPQEAVLGSVGGISGLASAGAGALVGGYGGISKAAALTGCAARHHEKRAGVSVGMLKRFLDGQLPLFHAVSKTNERGLLQTPRAMSAAEGLARGVVETVENSLVGTSRQAAGALIARPRLTKDRAVFGAAPLLRSRIQNLLDKKFRTIEVSRDGSRHFSAYDLATAAHPGAGGLAGRLNTLARVNLGGGKSWGNVSFTEGKPLREYGDFGVMTTPSRVSGELRRGVSGVGPEITAHPEWVFDKLGNPRVIRLPSAPGKIFYHPSKENAALAKELYLRYGRHSVLPLSRSTRAKLKRLSGDLKPFAGKYEASPETAQAQLVAGIREFPTQERRAGAWLANLMSGQAKSASISSLLRHAMNQTHTHPTPGQIEAGNYRKGDFRFRPGLVIKIESPEGTTRRGKSKSGKEWSVTMKHSYGYFRGSKGKDGDAVDVFIGPHPESDVVAVVNQEIDGKFDEHKVVVGIRDEQEAREVYLANYQKGWKCGPITMTNVEGLKGWLRDGKATQPFVKAANAWKRRLYEGKLGGYDLARILSALPPTHKAQAQSRLVPRRIGNFREKPFSKLQRLTLGNSKAQEYDRSAGAFNAYLRENASGMRRGVMELREHPFGSIAQRMSEQRGEVGKGVYGRYDGYNKGNMQHLPSGRQRADSGQVRRTLQLIQAGLRETSPRMSSRELTDKLRAVYKAPITDLNDAAALRNYKSGMKDFLKSVRNKDDYHLDTVGDYEPFRRDLHKRKTHHIWGYRYGDKKTQQMHSLADYMSEQAPKVPTAGVFSSMTRHYAVPRSAPMSVSRHEVAHGKHTTRPQLYENRVVRSMARIARRFPHLESSLFDPKLSREAVAQIIAGGGGSRSANRFNLENLAWGRDPRWAQNGQFVTNRNKTQQISSLLDRAMAVDPAGVQASVVTQLHKNYNVALPGRGGTLPPRSVT
jgi:hypothetical protein